MIQTKELDSGVRVIVKRMEGLLSVTMGVLVGTGAAFETDEEDGISHFIEHMQFKGTPTRTAFEISDAFDALGVQVNAFTGKDMTCYYAKSTSDHAAEAFSLLADLFLNANFPEEEMKREKGVVLEEIHMDEDSPEDLCLDLLSRAAFGKANYGRNILGPAANVRRFTREDLFRYKEERYCPQNIVVSFAGNIGVEEAVKLADTYFGSLKGNSFNDRPKEVVHHKSHLFKKKPIEQAHFAIGFPCLARDDEKVPAAQVMNAILGGGMSSRLFKRVREELGLAYSVYSFTSHYAETGLLTVYAAVNPQKAQAALEAVREVLETFAREGASEEEFFRGREQLKSGSIFSQENTSSQMLLYGRTLLYTGEVYDFEKRMAEITALTPEDLLPVLRSLKCSEVAMATVGNLEEKLKL